MIRVDETADGVVFAVRVVPRSSRTEYVGLQDGALKFRITAPPVEGKANEECIRIIADALGVAKKRVSIVGGHKSRTKRVAVSGATKGDIEEAFLRE